MAGNALDMPRVTIRPALDGHMLINLLATAALAGPLQLQTQDGVALSAHEEGAGENGVILVHGKGGSHADWRALSTRLSANGFHVVAVDLRGHGGSTGAPLGAEDYLSMTGDVEAAARWLHDNGAKEVSVIGAELGANVALNAASNSKSIANVLLLSPGLNHDGVKVGAAIGSWSGPLLLVSGTGDVMGAKAANILADKASGPKHLELPETPARGVGLLNSVPELEGLLISWLNGSFRSASDPASVRPEISTHGSEDIETTGTRLEDRR